VLHFLQGRGALASEGISDALEKVAVLGPFALAGLLLFPQLLFPPFLFLFLQFSQDFPRI